MRKDRDPRGVSPRGMTGRRLLAEPLEARSLLSAFFQNSFQTVGDRAGVAEVTVVRATDSSQAENFNFSAGGGTAVPGVDYVPVSQTLAFSPGETSKTVTVPVLPAGPNAPNTVVQLTLTPVPGNPIGGSTAYLEVAHNPDTTPPHVVSGTVRTRGQFVTGFTLTFSKDMAQGPAQGVHNYEIDDPRSLRPVRRVEMVAATREIVLKSAVYDPATRTVTLTPAGRVRKAPAFTVMSRELSDEVRLIAQAPPPTGAPLTRLSPITDTVGNPLDGNGDGTPDGHLLQMVSSGRLGRFLNDMFSSTPAQVAPATFTSVSRPARVILS
jgi:hypothetical protein